MASSPAPPARPWRTAMRERHVAAPRTATWAALIETLGTDPADLSVEPPWRHVRRAVVPGVDLCEVTVVVRDDGAESHLAWCVGLAADADDPQAGAVLARMAGGGEDLLHRVAEAVG